MDPASIFSIIAGSAGLALQCSKVIRDLHNVADTYKNADLTVISMSTSLYTIKWAWGRIQETLETWSNDLTSLGQDIDTATLDQLGRSLKGGLIVMEALEADLAPYTMATLLEDGSTAGKSGSMNRAHVVWNAKALKDHQERIRDQVASMNLLINVLQLPNVAARRQTLDENVKILRKSDESAYSIVPSRLSVLSYSIMGRRNDSSYSVGSERSLVYRELSIDDELFTARVYKRNYRSRLVQQILQNVKLASIDTSPRAKGRDIYGNGEDVDAVTTHTTEASDKDITCIEGLPGAALLASDMDPALPDRRSTSPTRFVGNLTPHISKIARKRETTESKSLARGKTGRMEVPHGVQGRYVCGIGGCSRVYLRLDNFVNHRRMEHQQ
ncbi:MAG: hypothetical protein Q9207_005122, partial [Kuettlingeria erythrocarpa]